MKKQLIFIFLLCSVRFCFAQDAIQPDDWDKKHADEASVVLFSSYSVELNKDGSYTEDINWITKIQNEDAMTLGEIPVFYNKRRQEIKGIKAYITIPDGKRYPYKMIQDGDTMAEGEYSDYRKKIVTMPNVVVGSTIDFRLKIFNKYSSIKGEYFQVVTLFSSNPLKHKIITLTVPEGIKLFFQHINTQRLPVVINKKGKTSYQWEFKNDDIYDEDLAKEDYAPPSIEFMPFTYISTIKNWPSFCKWYWKEFSENIITSPQIKEAVKRITGEKVSTEDKIRAIAKYLFDNVRYVKMNLEEHDFKPHPSDEVFKNKFGDCKDQSALFVTMLKEIGIEAYPVLVRNKFFGDISGILPAPGYFEHMIVAIKLDGKFYFVDPLVEGYRLNEIPYSLEGDYVLVIDDKGGEFMRLPYMDLSQKTTLNKSRVYLNEGGSALLETEFTLDKQASIDTRRAIKLASDKSKEEFMSYLENFTRGGKIINYAVIGQDDEYGFLTLKLKAENPRYLKPRGRIMIFGGTSVNLVDVFHLKERRYPVWLHDENVTISVNEYVIPQGFIFEYIPKAVNLKSEWVDVSVEYSQNARNIKQEVRQHFKRNLISPSKYKEFKEFLLKIENELDECIIIRKEE